MNAWSWLEVFGDRVFHASWQATCLVGLVLVLQRLLRHRLSPWWRHALWFPALIRLALPFTPPSAFSLFQWVPRSDLPTSTVRNPVDVASLNPAQVAVEPRMTDGNPRRDSSVADKASGAETFPLPEARDGLDWASRNPLPAVVSQDAREAKGDRFSRGLAASAGNAFSRDRGGGGLSWRQWLAAGWGLGVLGFLAFSAVGLSRFRARLRQCPRVKEPELLRLWSECQATLKVHGDVRLVESTAASGPALFGFRRLWLLLPPGFADRFTPEQLRHVFLHELAHLRRHDVAVHWIMALLQAVHWFNPVIWLAFARVRSAREEAADALALAAGSSGEAREYGLTVLQLVEESSRPTRLPGWVGILDEPGRLTERIESIAQFRAGGTVSRWPWALVLILGFVGLTDAPRSAPAAEKATVAVVGSAASTPAPEPTFKWQVVTNGPAVRVRVVDAATGQPLEGAEVVAPSPAVVWGFDVPKSARWFTDASGEVTIHLGIRPGTLPQHEQWFTTSVRRTGFASRGRSWLIPAGVALERVPERTEFRLQRGRTVGGVVRDEAAHPLAGIRVRLVANGHQYGPPGERDYPEFWQPPEHRDAIVTDAEGRWEVADFPADLDRVRIECWRPDGMVHRFEGKRPVPSNEETYEREWGDPIDMSAFLDKKATLVLPDGYTVRGRVVDPDGNAVAGARVRAAFGHETQTLAGETRSDASGRFAFLHRRPIEWILAAEVPGFAVSTTVVIVESNAPEAEIRLGRLDPLRLRVVDLAGMPLPGVEVSVDRNRSGPQIVDFSGTTDSTGTLVWTNAPPGALTFRIQSGNEPVERWVRLAPGERNREVRIRPGPATHVVVTGRAVEEGTDRPIVIGIVAFRAQANPTFSTVELETLEMLGEGRFRLRVPLDWFYPGSVRTYQLRLWAPGVGTVFTEFRDFDEGDWDLTARFRRGGAIQGTVRLADGRPASDAVLSASTASFGSLSIRDWGISAKEGLIQSHADVAGRYGVDDPGSDGPGASGVFVILHPEGFLEIPASRLREKGDVTLLRWGRIEGVLRSERGPIAGELVTLRRDSYGRFNMNWSLHTGTPSGPGGEFVFTNVPPGDYVLNRRFSAAGGPNFESHPMSVRVESGAPARVSYGGEGRSVIGRVRGRPLYWEAVTHRLVAERSLAQPPWPDPDRFATAESYLRWMAGYDGMHAWWAQRRIYGVTVERDGSFRAEDVPSGTYDLELVPYDPRSTGGSTRPEVPRLRRKVVVPPTTEADRGVPLDLGVLEFAPEAITPPP